MGQRGQLVLPVVIRRRLGLADGVPVVFDQVAGGVLVRPAKVVPLSEAEIEELDDLQDVEMLRRRDLDPGEQRRIPAEEVFRRARDLP